MKVLEVLLNNRWILKSRDRELYYQVKEALASGEEKKFLREKLGYQVLINPYMIKVEKLPAAAENWMGISEFCDPIEYVFFCLVLMFLEDKEAEDQFVLSELTEYVQSQYREEQIDWTIYRYRRHMIRVMKYCVGYTVPKDFEKEEWIDLDEDRGIIRRQRVYRRLLMTMGMYRDGDTEEDFAYVRNYRNMIQGELSEMFPCELQVHSSSAFLILEENCRLGRTFPEENTLSDIVLLLYQLLQEEIRTGRVEVPLDEQIRLPKENFQRLVEKCKEQFGVGFNKTYREMTFAEFYREVYDYMENLMMIEQAYGDIYIRSAAGKIMGKYPEDFGKEDKGDE